MSTGIDVTTLTDRDYLGDGVYVGFDGYQLWLYTTRDRGVEAIALEPEVFAKLIEYERRLTEKYNHVAAPSAQDRSPDD